VDYGARFEAVTVNMLAMKVRFIRLSAEAFSFAACRLGWGYSAVEPVLLTGQCEPPVGHSLIAPGGRFSKFLFGELEAVVGVLPKDI
jgi:hypothetical protein